MGCGRKRARVACEIERLGPEGNVRLPKPGFRQFDGRVAAVLEHEQRVFDAGRRHEMRNRRHVVARRRLGVPGADLGIDEHVPGAEMDNRGAVPSSQRPSPDGTEQMAERLLDQRRRLFRRRGPKRALERVRVEEMADERRTVGRGRTRGARKKEGQAADFYALAARPALEGENLDLAAA